MPPRRLFICDKATAAKAKAKAKAAWKPSPNTPYLPSEIIERIVQLIPPISNSNQGNHESSPDYESLRACLTVSSSFYVPAHKAIFEQVILQDTYEDPTYILRRIELLADLVRLSSSHNQERLAPGCILRSVAQDIRVLVILPNTIHPHTTIRDNLTTIFQDLVWENKGPSGGRLESLTITADLEWRASTPSKFEDLVLPDYVFENGDFRKFALELVASKSIRDLVMIKFWGIPAWTFEGCTFDSVSLIDCSFAIDDGQTEDMEGESDAEGVLVRAGSQVPASITSLRWEVGCCQEFGLAEQTALINPHLTQVEIAVDLSYAALTDTEVPGMLSGIFTSDSEMVNFKHVVFKLSSSLDGLTSYEEGRRADLDLSLEARVKLHSVPFVTLNVSNIAFQDSTSFVDAAWSIMALNLLLESFGNSDESHQHVRGIHTSNITILTLGLPPSIFWPLPGDFRLLARQAEESEMPLGADEREVIEEGAAQLELHWTQLDRWLSSPMYMGVEKLVIHLEGDGEGYLRACEEFEEYRYDGYGAGAGSGDESPQNLSPKRNLWAYLPKTMEMREIDKSVICIMGGMVFYPFN